MASKLDKEGLQKLIDSVSASLNTVLEKAEKEPSATNKLEVEPLNKTTPGNEAPAEKTSTGSSTEGSKPEESSASPEDKGEESSEAPSSDKAPPSAAPDASASPSPAPGAEGAPQGDPAQDQGGTVESLQAEYAALPVEELKMHMLACKAALMSQMAQGGADEGATGPAGMASAAPAPEATASATPPAAPAQEAAPPIAKSEDKALLDRVAALEASNTELKKSIEDKDKLIEGFGTIAKSLTAKITGQRKSVATMAAITKPGTELVKSEGVEITNISFEQAKAKLNTVTATTKLSKSDQTAVIKFVAGNDKDISKVAHLLK